MQVNGLPVFYKQRLRGLYPSWAYTAPGTYLRVYYSATEALIWSCIVYWLTGFAPDIGRQALLSLPDDSRRDDQGDSNGCLRSQHMLVGAVCRI